MAQRFVAFELETPLSLPSKVMLEASAHCQLKCPSCPTTDGSSAAGIAKGTLHPIQFQQLLADNPWIRQVELANYGEMFLNPRLIEILALAQERKVDLMAETGVNLNHAHEDVLEALVKYKLRKMTVSIDGASAGTYAVYRKGGDFDRVLTNIRAINAYKHKYASAYPMLTWQFIVFGHNEHEIEQARQLAKSLGMAFRLKLTWDDDFSPLPHEAATRLRHTLGAATRAEYQKKYGEDYGQGICHQLWDAPQLNWDGAVLGCCRNFWGNFGPNAYTHGLRNVLKGEKMQYARAMLFGKAQPRADIPCTTCDIYLGMAARKSWLKRGARMRLRTLLSLTDRTIGLGPRHGLDRLKFALLRRRSRSAVSMSKSGYLENTLVNQLAALHALKFNPPHGLRCAIGVNRQRIAIRFCAIPQMISPVNALMISWKFRP